MSFKKKLLTAEFSLAKGKFSGKGNAASLSGLRMSATIDVSGGISSGNMALSIYGLPLSMMNQMSTVGTQLEKMDQNKIKLLAGEEGGTQSLIFSGLIHNAYVDAEGMPQVCFRISAVPGGGYWAVAPADPVSKPGPQKVKPILEQLASQMGLTLEAKDIDVTLMNPYYGGSPWGQVQKIARHANLDIVAERGKLVVTKKGKKREGGPVEVSARTGMVGYPAFREATVIVTKLFDPSITCLSEIEIKSDLTPACGKWRVNHIIYELESQVPHGRWFQIMECTKSGG